MSQRRGEQGGRWEEIGGGEPQEKRRAIEAPSRGQGEGYQQTYHHNPVFNQFIRRVYPEGSYSPGMGPVPLITCPPGGGGGAGVGGFQGSSSMMQCPPWSVGLPGLSSPQVPPGNHQHQEEYRQVPPPTCLLESNQQQPPQQFTLDCDMRNQAPSARTPMMQSQHQANQAPGGSLEPPGGGLDQAAFGSPQRRSRWDLPPLSPPITVLDGEDITKKDGNNGMVASSSSSGFKPFKINPQASSGKVLIGKRRGGGKALPTGVIKRQSPSEVNLKTTPGQNSSTQQPPPTWSRYLAEVEQYKSHICSDPNPNRSLVK